LQNGINWVNNGDLTFKDFMKINFKHADQQTMRIMLYKKRSHRWRNSMHVSCKRSHRRWNMS